MTDRPPRHRLHRRILLACVALWLCAFAVSHLPAEKLPKVPVSDKKMHFGGFFVLALTTLLTLSARGMPARSRSPLCLAIAAVYAAFDETTQPLVNRYCDVWDYAADMTGAAAGIVVFEIAATLRRKRLGRQRTNLA